MIFLLAVANVATEQGNGLWKERNNTLNFSTFQPQARKLQLMINTPSIHPCVENYSCTLHISFFIVDATELLMWTGGEWHKVGHWRGKATVRWEEEGKEVMPGELLRSLHLLPLAGSCGTCPCNTSLSAAPYLREDSHISDWEGSWHTVMALNGKFNLTVNNWKEAAQMSQTPAI